jgi:cullin-associated NEDD8-dissociated protein 1
MAAIRRSFGAVFGGESAGATEYRPMPTGGADESGGADNLPPLRQSSDDGKGRFNRPPPRWACLLLLCLALSAGATVLAVVLTGASAAGDAAGRSGGAGVDDDDGTPARPPTVDYVRPSQPGQLLFAVDPAVLNATKRQVSQNGTVSLTLAELLPWARARSYDGHAWEATVNLDRTMAHVHCVDGDGARCLIDEDVLYVEATLPREVVEVTDEAKAARLLIQATFGPTRESIAEVVNVYGMDFEAWFDAQVALPLTSLRAYYRSRVNVRAPIYHPEAETYMPCDRMSRWHTFVVSWLDDDETVVVTRRAGNSAFSLEVNGFRIGEISSWRGEPYPATEAFGAENSQTFTICAATQSLTHRSFFQLTQSTCTNDAKFSILQTEIAFASIPTSSTVVTEHVSDAEFTPVVGVEGAYILTKVPVGCVNKGRNSFMLHDGVYYRYDPRIRTLTNTLEEPAQPTDPEVACPSAARSFVNEDSCVRREACAPAIFEQTAMTLNDDNLRAWYTGSRRYTYHVTGLKLEDDYAVSPCASGWSRWLRTTGSCSAETVLDSTTAATIRAALSSSTDSNPVVRDIVLSGASCDASDDATIGASIQVGGTCFTHVHPDLHNVHDFSFWSTDDAHPGNAAAANGGRPNPIKAVAVGGAVELSFPSASHPMARWSDNRHLLPLVGRYMDSVDFNTLATELQTVAMADHVGAQLESGSQGFEQCGSRYEVGNNPVLGSQYRLEGLDSDAVETYHQDGMAKGMVWTNAMLSAPDQLRQRAAWALSQIFTVSTTNFGLGELKDFWFAYYDILIQHAFGNYRDILREVSFSPAMAGYLSYLQNKAFGVGSGYPDENYAREIMQLFSIGLYKLHNNGTEVTDERGVVLETYTNDNIVSFARIWTGFDLSPFRGNIEETLDRNRIDPLKINEAWRDRLPKHKLDHGFIGDHYPLCEDLPPRHWLRPGATWTYTGNASAEGSAFDSLSGPGMAERGRFAPRPATSALYQALCAPNEPGAACTFPGKVVLDAMLPCDGQECGADRVVTAQIVDDLAGVTRYYTYSHVPCVQLTFYQGVVTNDDGRKPQCAKPTLPMAPVICCFIDRPKVIASNFSSECLFGAEFTTYATAIERCAAQNMTLCENNPKGNWQNSCTDGAGLWINKSDCHTSVQVYDTGLVEFVDPTVSAWFDMMMPSSGATFDPRWDNDSFPTVEGSSCSTSCVELETALNGITCLCNVTEVTLAVYGGPEEVPSTVDELLVGLSIGSVPIGMYDPGSSALCESAACASLTHVKVWLPADASPTAPWDERVVFELASPFAGHPNILLLNKESVVHLDSYSFRNPPNFLPLGGSESRDFTYIGTHVWRHLAYEEVEALIDHLFEHPNTAPFVSYRLIQRLVTSNPSPRYVDRVATAFRTGMVGNRTFSGRYGDLAATFFAILCDHEARSPLVEADPRFGLLREPLLKVMHFLRSMVFTMKEGREAFFKNMEAHVGQMAFFAPSVFGFYLPENRPQGPISAASIVSPEFELATSPLVISYLNAMTSLIDIGLSSCYGGFSERNSTDKCKGRLDEDRDRASGHLMYDPTDSTSAAAIVDEMDVLLTGGRLNDEVRAEVVDAVAAAISLEGLEEGIREAQRLFMMASEFHTTNANSPSPVERVVPPEVEPKGRPYKSIIVLFLNGGADSFNVFVPYDGCESIVGKDLFQEYRDVRTVAALSKADLLPIDVSGQPCARFGLPLEMPTMRDLYEAGDAAILANTGVLVEPVTKETVSTKGKDGKQLPPGVFGHNVMQRSLQTLHPQDAGSDGLLGRIASSLRSVGEPFSTEVYSVVGSSRMVSGDAPPKIVSYTNGISQFRLYDRLAPTFENMTSARSESVFAETYATTVRDALKESDSLGATLDATTLNATFPGTSVGRQFAMAARLMKMRESTKAERGLFFTSMNGFDTHSTMTITEKMGEFDAALAALRTELELQGIWDDTVLVTVSDFGRSLTTNGAGTDHAWGGHYFVVGGSVKGGQVFGTYPSNLTGGDLDLGRGRVLPTRSYDSVWNAIVRWFGVPDADIPSILPNVGNFPESHILSSTQLFGD